MYTHQPSLPRMLLVFPLLLALTVVSLPGRSAGAPTEAANCGPFPDVADTNPACEAILKLFDRGVISGYPDGSFRPDNPVTRAEFAKMSVVAFDYVPDPDGSLPFSDVAGHWAATQGYLQAAVAMNAINGFEDSTFRPDESITRAQSVKVPAAALNLYPWGTAPYSDIAQSDWFSGWVSVGHRAQLIGPEASFPVWTEPIFSGNATATRAEAALLLGNLPLTPNEAEQAISLRAAAAVAALQNQDMAALAALSHPVREVRFSPYGYVQTEWDGDLVFGADWIGEALTDPIVYTWGSYDGKGTPIELTFSHYYDRFIYDQDFASAPDVSYNTVWQRGNTINNTLEAYPDAAWVEYHFPGFDPQYEGMDWRSLRLVFAEHESTWYLIGIIHDEWTI